MGKLLVAGQRSAGCGVPWGRAAAPAPGLVLLGSGLLGTCVPLLPDAERDESAAGVASSRGTADGAGATRDAGAELDRISGELQDLIGRFRA